VITEALDLEGLQRVLTDMSEGRIRCLAVDTPVPSQFSHEILNANPYAYLDDAPLEERRARAVEMRRVLPQTVLSEIGRLDPAAIAAVRDDAWPDVRDAEELHDALLSFVALPVPQPGAGLFVGAVQTKLLESVPQWTPYFEQLAAERRVGRARVGESTYWVAAERVDAFRQIFPSALFDIVPRELPAPDTSRDAAQLGMVSGWMAHSGPISA